MRALWLLLVALLMIGAAAPSVEAQQCFLGQVFFFAGPVPTAFTPADGRLLAIPPPITPGGPLPTPDESLRNALLSLIGTQFGGSATTFALPDLRGRAPLGVGQGTQGLTLRAVGNTGGAETVTLSEAEMSAHSHAAMGTNDAATDADPEGSVWAGKSRTRLYGQPTALAAMDGNAVEPTGNSEPVDNMTPFLALNPAVCAGLNSVFPARP